MISLTGSNVGYHTLRMLSPKATAPAWGSVHGTEFVDGEIDMRVDSSLDDIENPGDSEPTCLGQPKLGLRVFRPTKRMAIF